MHILTFNGGSGSQRAQMFTIDEAQMSGDPLRPDWKAVLDTTEPDQPEGEFYVKVYYGNEQERFSIPADLTLKERAIRLVETLWKGEKRVLQGPAEVNIVGHRVVHGGRYYDQAVLIDSKVEKTIEKMGEFSPLHNPPQLEAIRALQSLFGTKVPQAAVFDTAFHRTLPKSASTYPGPYSWLEQQICRYGFHGTNFRYVSAVTEKLMGRENDPNLRVIICHLGGGCSLCAVRGGKSIDTTMGFTPLDGIAMCTRSGSLDPGILLYLMRQGMSPDDIEKVLNKQSGLAGLSGLAGDTRVVLPKALAGEERAKLALDVFVHRLRAGIGSMLGSLGGMDALVFTDVISVSDPLIREMACEPFACTGLRLNKAMNHLNQLNTDLSSRRSNAQIFVIESAENWQIARECFQLVKRSETN
ncbi:MAG: acetate/propionate family kinase, partial [Verrucomicrobia bacterium]|nr:acetate/propionate family kinase [Verrucomicrobiota bacterium]